MLHHNVALLLGRLASEDELIRLADLVFGRIKLRAQPFSDLASMTFDEFRVHQVQRLQTRRGTTTVSEVEVSVWPIEKIEEGMFPDSLAEEIDASTSTTKITDERLMLPEKNWSSGGGTGERHRASYQALG